MQAYTYSIKHLPSGKWYYGVRKSQTDDIGITYFSSSKVVKELIETDGIQSFDFKIRKRFDDYSAARKHEIRFLRRCKVVSNDRFLNLAITSPVVCSGEAEERRKKSLSTTMKNLWKTEEYRKKQLDKTMTTEQARERGALGHKKRRENFESGVNTRKKKTYGKVVIVRNDITKIISANHVPAYKKIGWERAT